MKIEKLVPDTSVIIEGIVSKKIEKKEISVDSVMIHEAIIAELEHQANMNKTIGYLGLDEINRIRELSKKLNFRIEFSGKRPKPVEIKYAKRGEIDSLIRELAYESDAALITADKVQAKVAEAKGIKFILIEVEVKARKLKLEGFFDAKTMSAHLRENISPFVKRGVPGDWEFVKKEGKKLTQEDVREIAKEIIEEANMRRDSFIEIDRPGSTIIQLGLFRIVITRPPFSDGWEITAVRPIKKLDMADYKISEKLERRIEEHAEGILIAGAPGMGKTTFAQALAEHYANKNKIVKTVEAPRDLVLPDSITQYAISHGTPQEIHDILLLSRPDYTLFDEMRNTEDFRLFADLRLAGVGMVGVIHATKPIDAIQRFLGRIELGMIPHVIDTVLFIKNGQVEKVFNVAMQVKVPSGMTEADLARPIVVISDFETGSAEFEIYSYGEETVVVPVQIAKATPLKELAARAIKNEMEKYADVTKVEVASENKAVVYVPEKFIPGIIGRGGKNIEKIEEKIGMSLDIRETEEAEQKGKAVRFDMFESGNYVIMKVDPHLVNKNVNVHVGGEYLLTMNVGKKGDIRIKKSNNLGKVLLDALIFNRKVEVTI